MFSEEFSIYMLTKNVVIKPQAKILFFVHHRFLFQLHTVRIVKKFDSACDRKINLMKT